MAEERSNGMLVKEATSQAELEALRVRRIQEASKKGYFSKLDTICRHYKHRERYPKKHGNWIYVQFEKGRFAFVLRLDDYAPNASISVNGQIVANWHLGHIKAFRPGNWEEVFEQWWQDFKESLEAKQRPRKLQELAGKSKAWLPIDV